MPISLTCPGCKKTLKIAEKLAGKRAKCPGCQAPVTIPALSAPIPTVPTTVKEEEEWGLAPLDDDPPLKQKATPPKPAPAAAKTAAAKPVAAALSKPAQQPAAAKPKAPVAKTPSSDLDDFGLAPLDDELFSNGASPKPTPTVKKPVTPVPAKPTAAAKPASAASTAKPTTAAPAKSAPSKSQPPSDDLFLEPLSDDLLMPTAKKGKARKPTATAEDEEDDFNLLPLSDLSHDPLGAALPMAASAPNPYLSGAVAAANSANPYAAPQTLVTVNQSTANLASFPVFKTIGDFFQLYFSNIANSALLGVKMILLNFGFAIAAFALLYTILRLAIAVEMSYMVFRPIWWLTVVALIVAWFSLQCWLIKGLLNYGYCVAMNDERGAEGALTSPGSLIHFIITGVLNLALTIVFGALLITPAFFVHYSLALPAVMGIGIFANLICLNFYYYFHREVNCLNVFYLWWIMVKPHLVKYALLIGLMNIITMILSLVMMYVGRLAWPAILKELLPYLPKDPNIVIGLAALMINGVMLGVFGSYYSILQGVCFKRMVRIYEREYD